MARVSNPRTNNVTERKESRYVQGGTSDRFPNRVGWWDKKTLPKADTDISIIVQEAEAGRPDLIAFKVYGKTSLQWLVLQYNAIVDITTEIVPGAELRLPTPRRVQLDILTNQTGGNRTS